MRQGFASEFQYLLLGFLFLSFFGLSSGLLLPFYLLGLAGYLGWTLYQLQRLHRWIISGLKEPMPHIPGIVGIIGDSIYRMNARHSRAKTAHRTQLKRINNLTNSLAEGVIVLNQNKELDWWNPAAAVLLNLQKTDANQPIQNLLRNPKFVNFLDQKDYSSPLELVSPFNELQILLFTAAVFNAGNTVLIVTDISRLRKLEQMRKDFIANLSHEIKTPLTVLTGYIETLQDSGDDLPPGWEPALKQMASQTERINNLAIDLVALSQLEASEGPTQKERVVLYPLLSQIIEDAKALSDNQHLIIMESFDQSLALQGDQKELYSAFSNLVFNAVAHNPPGTKINISVTQPAHGDTHIIVADNGTGIDPKYLPRLTERFYRVDNSRNSNSGGTGLGLAIVKHALARHQGRLEIQSAANKGSTFSCQFRQQPNL